MNDPTPGSRFRARILLWSMIASMGATAVVAVAYVGQRRGFDQLARQAARQGLMVGMGPPQRRPFDTITRDVTIAFKSTPGVTATINRAVVHAGWLGQPRILIDQIHLVLTAEPDGLHRALQDIAGWEGPAVTWRVLNVTYNHRLFGNLTLTDVRVERREARFVVRAGQMKLAAASWPDIVFAIGKRNTMIEIALGDPSATPPALQLGYFPSTGFAAQWTLTAAHQPAAPLARRLGWHLDDAFDRTRVVGSLTFTVPDDRTRPLHGRVQMAIDGWPRPPWNASEALLGSVASFAARIDPSDDPSRWDLTYAQVTLSLFSMTGAGRIQFGRKPALVLEATGERTCAQMRGHLPESPYLDQVKGFIGPARPPAPATKAARPTPGATRALASARLRLQLAIDDAKKGMQRPAAWRMDAGCGLPALSTGVFQVLDLPAGGASARAP